ncbi:MULTISPECIES: sigma-70 family RNA polymerase sigma factor [unclassified Paenibacillus]|uniref:sigma-70 family RNA polymerase sigma factor n=1 Tax=unclassified Paenibacillus TaxID=185978 RepID=UPI00363FCD95
MHEFKMDPNDIPVPQNRLTNTELVAKRSHVDRFITGSNFTDSLLWEVKHIPFFLAISDSMGYLLKVFSNTNTFRQFGIAEGVQFNEKEVGINSISMSARFQKPVKITGNEHFHYCLQDKSCFSTPLHVSEKLNGTLSIMTSTEHLGEDLVQFLIALVKKTEQNRIVHEFYELYYQDVYRYLYHLSNDKEIAKDLSQQTFLFISKGITSFKNESSPKSWIYRIAHNTFISWYRKEKKFVTLNIDQQTFQFIQIVQNQFLEPQQFIEKRSQLYELMNCVSQLKPEHQKVIYLREIKLLTYKEISDITGWSIANIKSMLFRARNKLKILLEKSQVT